ncbi:MAG: tandem-95 repeat protein, partial [Candidatus Cloacimonetes bacterium]|nr:tandem-95 repeat protein [Candidatus Cloacimonadota bacterium]
VYISAPADWYGIETLEICIDDGEIEVCDSLQIVVLPVNDAPVLDLPALLDFEEDGQITVDISEYCFDIDGDALSLLAESEILVLEWEGLLLQISAPADWNGETDLSLTVYDGNGGEASGNIAILVESINDNPVLDLPVSFTFAEDESLIVDLSQYCSDIDGDELIYTIDSEEIITAIEGSILTLSAEADWNGSEVIAVEVEDGQTRVEVSDLTTIIVTAVNDAPIIELPAEISFLEDGEINLDFAGYCQDIDSAELTIEMITASENIFAEISGLMVTLSSAANWSGSEEIAFSLSDEGFTVTDTLTVTVTPVIDEAELALPQVLYTEEDIEISTNFSDYIIDLEYLDYYLTSEGSEHLQVDINEYDIIITPAANWFGEETLEFHLINDQYNIDVIDNVLIVVSPVNDSPVFELLTVYQFAEDTDLEIDLSIYASDIDNDNLSYSVENNNPDLMINLNGSLAVITASENYYGSQNVQFTVTDGQYDVSSITEIEVTPVNDAPVLNLPESISFLEDMSFVLDLSLYANDIDNDDLVYSVEADTLTTEITGSLINIWAPLNWHGSEIITIVVNDQVQRLSVSGEITVNVTPVNDPPWLELPDEIVLEQGESVTLDISLYGGDIDSDYLEVLVDAIEIETVIEDMLLTLIAPENWAGTCQITVSLSDSEDITSDEITVIVNSSQVTCSYDLVENWNWVSFNTLPENSELENVLFELEGIAEQIKAQNVSSTWYANWGWVGQLSELEAGKMYLLKLAEDYNGFTVTGEAANPQMPIPLTTDWNWIGHLPQEPYMLAELMAPLEPGALQIKAQNISSTWYESWGWVGQLTALEAGVGYKLQMSEPDTLIYPLQRQKVRLPDSIDRREQWRVNPGFENNMSLLADINIEALEGGTAIREVAFFDETGLCHGTGTYISELDLWYFTVGGDEEQQSLTMKIITAENQEYSLEPQIEFCNNAISGEPDLPLSFELSINPDTDNQVPAITSLGQSYPNPCLIKYNRANINIPCYLAASGFTELMIYNCKGQLVRRLLSADMQPGEYLISWDGEDDNHCAVSSGIYLYQLKSEGRVYNQKMMLLR